MSRRSRQLKRAFDIEVSEGRLRGLTARARAAAVEAATRRFERGVSDDIAREVQRQEQQTAQILEQRQKDQEKQQKERAQQQARRDRELAQQQHSACTCRKPRLDSKGKCTRCKKIPAIGRRR